MSLIHKIEEVMMEYGGGSRQSIGAFIREKKGSLTKYSLQEIADATYTSKAAVTRFAKALGFSGWREFLKAFWEEQSYQEQHYTDIDANYPFAADSSRQDIINQLCSLQVESLLDTADLLDHAPLKECAELLLRAKRIAMFGLNPNLTLAELFQRKMLSIGRPVELPSMGDKGMLAHSLTAEDCAIIISYSGNSLTHGPLSVLPVLEERAYTDFYRRNAEIQEYNERAKELMRSLDVEIDDLYAVAAAWDESAYADWVHFNARACEALADAALKYGIPRADAYRMASQMIVGTGKLQLASGTHPAAMKDAVCSPGGTTIVGVAELERRYRTANEVALREASLRYRVWILGLAAVLVAMAAVWAVVSYRRKLRRRDEQLSESLALVDSFRESHDSLTSRLDASNARQAAVKRLLEGRMAAVRDIAATYYTYGEGERLTAKMRELALSPAMLADVVDMADLYSDRAVTRLREEFPGWTERNYDFAALVIAGFTPQEICVMLDMSLNGVYTLKSKLKRRIADSAVADREKMLSLFA